MSALTNTELLSIEDQAEYIVLEEPEYIDSILSYLEILTSAITAARSKAAGLALIRGILLPD